MLDKMTTPHGPNISGFSSSEEAILKKLPAYITYEKFETNKGSSDYSIKCDSLKSTGDQAKELCEKFAVNLQSICKTGSTTSSPSSTLPTSTAGASGTSTTGNSINLSEAKANCLLLKYWLFNEIRKLNLGGNEKKDKNLDTLIHIIYYLQFEIYTKNGNKFYCFNDIYEYLDNWEEEKFLYEYFMNVPKIECINKNNGTDCKAYEKYVNRVKTYYNEKKKKELCCRDNYFKCSDYFNCDPKYHPDTILNKINGTDTSDEGASVPRSQSESENDKKKPETRIENIRCIVRRNREDPHLAYLSCFKVPTVYKNVDDYFIGTDISQKQIKNNSEGKDASSSSAVRGSATNTGSPSEGSQTLQRSNTKSEDDSSDSSPVDNILDQVKSLRGLGTYLRNIIDSEYPLFKSGKKITIENYNTLTSTTQHTSTTKHTPTTQHTSTTQESVENVQTENIEENLDFLEPSNNLFNTKRFKSIMTAILTFVVIFVFFLYYKFTPLGSCLSRRFQKKRKTPSQFQEINAKPVSEPSQKNQNINTKTGRARIAYHPT